MKKLILFLVLVFVLPFAFAAMSPYEPFCEHQGYKIEIEEHKQYCVFNDAERCELNEFYKGECGAKYVKGFPCVEEGNLVFHFEECCEGSEPYLKPNYIGQAACKKVSVFEKAEMIFYMPIGWFIILLVIIAIIIGAVFYLKRKGN